MAPNLQVTETMTVIWAITSSDIQVQWKRIPWSSHSEQKASYPEHDFDTKIFSFR